MPNDIRKQSSEVELPGNKEFNGKGRLLFLVWWQKDHYIIRGKPPLCENSKDTF